MREADRDLPPRRGNEEAHESHSTAISRFDHWHGHSGFAPASLRRPGMSGWKFGPHDWFHGIASIGIAKHRRCASPERTGGKYFPTFAANHHRLRRRLCCGAFLTAGRQRRRDATMSRTTSRPAKRHAIRKKIPGPHGHGGPDALPLSGIPSCTACICTWLNYARSSWSNQHASGTKSFRPMPWQIAPACEGVRWEASVTRTNLSRPLDC